MKTVAIICEYNPITNGHIAQLLSARKETGCDTVICVMSGSFTQRGDAAILDKYQRALLAVSFGADMVVELPQIYAFSPADNFAYGAIKTISALPNVTHISFGSECGNIDLLKKAADFLADEPDEYKTLLAKYQADGNSYPKSRSLALAEYAQSHEEYLPIASVLDAPNNTLAIAYINAIKRFGLDITLHTVKREDNYNEQSADSEYPSASAVRYAFRHGHLDDVKKAVHPLCYEYLIQTESDCKVLENLCLYKMQEINGYDLAEYYDVSEGLNNRLKLAALDTVRYEDYLERAKTKRYTMARLRRISLYTLFDVTKKFYEEAKQCPPYVTVLALSKPRKDILTELNKSCDNVLLRYSDLSKVDKAVRPLVKLDFRAQGVLALINKTPSPKHSFVLV